MIPRPSRSRCTAAPVTKMAPSSVVVGYRRRPVGPVSAAGSSHVVETRVGISPGDRGEQAVDRRRALGADVEQHEAPGPVGVLGHPRVQARLAEQRRLLVPGDARHRDAAAEGPSAMR